MTQLALATRLAESAYLKHLERVSEMADKEYGDTYATVAMLHDLLEDCPQWNKESLLDLFDDEVVDAVVALTKPKDKNYEKYIEQVSNNQIARAVKLYDLLDNMDISRLKKIDEGTWKRLQKYHKAYHKLMLDDCDE
mgnify:CR=1 FL=1